MKDPWASAKVLLVGNFPPPHGGVSLHIAALREALLARGATVKVLDIGGRGHPEPGVVAVRTRAALALQLALHPGWLLHAQISGHSPKAWLVALAVGAARTPLAPLALLTVHSGLVPNYLRAGRPGRLLAAAAGRLFGRILAVSEPIAASLREAGVPADRLTVTTPFINLDERPGTPPPGLNELRREHPVLLAAAVAPGALYGARILLAALPAIVARHPGTALALFGPGCAETLREQARRYGVEREVRYFGELAHPQALAVTAACDVFVRPALADGDAISVREALALGKPAVVTDVGHRPAGCVRVRAGDPGELVRGVDEALARGGAAPAREAAVEGVLEAYRELLERRRAVRAAGA